MLYLSSFKLDYIQDWLLIVNQCGDLVLEGEMFKPLCNLENRQDKYEEWNEYFRDIWHVRHLNSLTHSNRSQKSPIIS